MPSSLQIKAFISWENLVRGVQMESCGHLSGVPVSLSTLGFSLRTLSTFSASSQQGLSRKSLKRLQIHPICVVPRGFTPFHQCTLASTNSLILQWNSYLCPLCLYQVSQCSYSVSPLNGLSLFRFWSMWLLSTGSLTSSKKVLNLQFVQLFFLF